MERHLQSHYASSRCYRGHQLRSLHSSAQLSDSPQSIPYPFGSLKSDTHEFTPTEFDHQRLIAMISACCGSNNWDLLSALLSYVPIGLEAQALEAILPCQIYAGIPRTIEGAALVRKHLDERSINQSTSEWLISQRVKSRAFLHDVISDPSVLSLIDRLPDSDGMTPRPYQSLSPDQPSLPPHDSSYPPVCDKCGDINSTAIRQHRGDKTLHMIYGESTTEKLLIALRRSHPALMHSVQSHIYGHVLCTPLLNVHELEFISISCLVYQRTPRQLFSHVRGALMNGATRTMCERVLMDAEAVYRHGDQIERTKITLPWIEDAKRLIVKIDRKVNPGNYSDTAPEASKL